MKNREEDKIPKKIIRFALSLAFILIPLTIAYFWKEGLSLDVPIKDGKLGTYGDFIGGVLGSVWTLCGVILFYQALKEQRNDFKTNNEALVKQVEALEVQGNEFALQRQEMELSRKISREQSKTLDRQRFETTYFSLIDLYRKSVADLNSDDSKANYFRSLRETFLEGEKPDLSPIENYKLGKDRYADIFFMEKEELGQYFKIIYRIVKIIDQSKIEEIEKFNYIKILRSQISENEMLALYYNSHSDFGGEFYKLILKYNFLKHLPCISKIGFNQYLLAGAPLGGGDEADLDKIKKSAFLHRFSCQVADLLRTFQEKLEREIKEDTFVETRISVPLPLCEDYIISLGSSEYNELTIQIMKINGDEIHEIAKLSKAVFQLFFCELLHERYWFSQYLEPKDNVSPILIEGDKSQLIFKLKSHKKLLLSCDPE